MKHTHTPGPWIANISDVYSNTVITEDGIGIARVIDDDDARLIAAAPMLFDALEVCKDYFEKRGPHEDSIIYETICDALKSAQTGA